LKNYASNVGNPMRYFGGKHCILSFEFKKQFFKSSDRVILAVLGHLFFEHYYP
jgi:hypothetical protein